MNKYILLLIPLFFLLSCGSELDTVTVQSDTDELFKAPDTTKTTPDSISDEFVHIKLGEIAAIESLDPLFATSNSEFRINHLIYEGLTGLNDAGNASPELARRWEVNSDSTQFTFHLRTNVFFHDSPVFESGNGRRFTAQDVRFVFERMAHTSVPNFTAQTFKDIRGFSAYHHEQTYVKDPAKRVLNTIEGIKIRNDSTVVFFTNKPASDLLTRLAHPRASIYPRESVPKTPGPIQQASGTGRYSYIQKDGNVRMLTVNDDYRGFTPAINRLDIVSGLSQKDLYQEFARQNLDALLEVGTSTLLTIADTTGNLLNQFYQDYDLERSPVHTNFTLYFNKNSGQAGPANELLSEINPKGLVGPKAYGTISLFPVDTTLNKSATNRQLVATQSNHPEVLYLLDKLATVATAHNFSFSMSASYAPSDETTFTDLHYPDTQKYLNWEAPIYILSRSNFSGLKIETTSWNLDLISVRKSGGTK